MMALNIVTRQKVLLSSLFMGGPLCSYAVLRCPAYSSFKVINRVYENMNVNLKSKCDALATPTLVSSRLLHHGHKNMTENNTYATGITLSERDSDSENDNDNENDVNILLDSKTKLSSRDWNNLKEKLKSDHRYSQVPSLDGIIMKQCLRQENYWLATSYTEYLNSQGKEPNLLGLGCYLQLCGLSIEECGEEKVLDVYNQLCSKVKVFDVSLSEHAIIALTKTSEWRRAFKHLPVIKKLCNVSAKVYSSLIEACFMNGEYDTGWQLFEAICREEKEPLSNAYIAWLKQCESGDDVESMASLLFNKFMSHDLYPQVSVIKEIKKLYEEKRGWSGMYMKVHSSGECPACGHHLENLEVNAENFDILKEEFASRILYGSDIFQSTSPGEWKRFVQFLEREGPFSTIVDGLNVAYTVGKKSPQVRMKRIREAVQKLKVANRKGNIMVIGRKHMIDWSPRDLEAINRRAVVFTLDNISKDDGFMLYAALHSGLGTRFVSSDMLRDHVYRLGDSLLRETFRHWQRGHQILAVPSPIGVQLVPPPSFRTAAQKQNTEGWHIPYHDGSVRESYQVPTTWLCLQSKPHLCRDITSGRVSDVPYKYTPENGALHHSNALRNSNVDPHSPEADIITLTGKLLGSQKADSKPIRIPYGKVYPKSKDSRPFTEDFNKSNSLIGSSQKSSVAKNKMREDMYKIMRSGKDRKKYPSVISDRTITSEKFVSRDVSGGTALKSQKKFIPRNVSSDTRKQ